MEEQTLRDEIRKLIARNKTEDAFEVLSSIQFSNEDKQLIVLNSQYNRIKEELRLNIISRDEGERRINQINMALLDISNKMDSSKSPSSEYKNLAPQKQSFNPRLLLLLLIPPAAFMIYWTMNGTIDDDNRSSGAPIDTFAESMNGTIDDDNPASEIKSFGDNFYQIRSKHKEDSYLHNENGKIEVGPIKPNWFSSQWKLIPVKETDYYQINSRHKEDFYLHNENGKAEIGLIKPHWFSSQWKLIPVKGNDYFQINSRHKKDSYLHNENGKIEVGTIKPHWFSSQWELIPIK